MADVIGSAEFELRAQREQLKKDLNEAERDLKGFADRAETTANSSAGGISRATRAITAGVVALSAAFAAGLAIALQFGQASLKMADALDNSARRIGVSTTVLQEFQYVARKTGEDATAVGSALETFANKFASAQAGLSKNDLKLFRSIGLEQDDLRRFTSVNQALEETVDRIGALKSAADRAAIAEQLGLGPLATALREGSDEVARLRDEAQALGFVMDEELIRKGAAAQGQLDDLAQVIGVQLAGAFIDLSDEVLSFTSYIADATRGLSNFIDMAKTWRGRVDAMYGEGLVNGVQEGGLMGPLKAFGSAFGSVISGRTFRAAADIRSGNSLPDFSPINPAALDALASSPPAARTPRTGLSDVLTVPSGRTRTDNSAQRAAEREARRAERVEQEIYRARQRLLQVAEGDILTAQQRFDLAQQQLKMDRDARDAEIESKAARGEIKAAERRSLEAANAEADALEDRVAADNAFREIQDERLANERLIANLTADLLSLQSTAARTAKERQRIELELLEINQRQRRDALRLELERNPSLTPGQRQEALDQLGRVDGAERNAVLRNTMSPLEAWRDQSLRTADEIAEAYESVAARGLDALNDGIVDAIMNTRSLGDAFSQVAQQIVADLISISVRKGITDPLSDLLFGGGASSGGGGLFSGFGSWLKGKIPGFSSGIENFSGGLAYVHQGEVLTNLAPGTSVIPASKVGAMGGGSVRVIVETNDDRFNAYVDSRAAPMAAASYAAGKADQQRAARAAPYRRG